MPPETDIGRPLAGFLVPTHHHLYESPIPLGPDGANDDDDDDETIKQTVRPNQSDSALSVCIK